MQKSKINAYKQVNATSSIETASPHKIIQMLLEGALEKLAVAKGAMQREDRAAQGEQISLAIGIVDGLRMSLDKSIENEMVSNLDALYDYMGRSLLEANLKNDMGKLDEVMVLISEIKSGWDAIPSEHHDAHTRPDDYLE